MKKFVSDLVKKEVMTSDGELIGTVDNFVIDTDTGEIRTVLVKATGGVSIQGFQRDAKGRYMIPLPSMKSFKDVFVVDNSRSSTSIQ